MQASVKTLSFLGIKTIGIDVQVQILNGLPAFTIVGLPDKAVAESRERIRAALFAMGIALPAKRITVNLAPADVQKEGSHYDLPIALAVLAAMEILSADDITNCVAIGELALNGDVSPVVGVLSAAVFAKKHNCTLICPNACAQEAVWAGEGGILAPPSLVSLINHFKGTQILPKVTIDYSKMHSAPTKYGCFSEVKGQLMAKRALEVAAAGGHNVIMLGPPGVGKSLLASRIPGILPPMTAEESLEVTMIHSLAGRIINSGLVVDRPYRAPHHSASLAALVGGGVSAKPGEISLAHRGVLFLDELPEFSRMSLEALRQPLETGNITVSRANVHITYPARIQLVAAMNPCRCGHLGHPGQECPQAPRCGKEYLSKISGPLLDRIDIFLDIPDITVADFESQQSEKSEVIKKRVLAARKIQLQRYDNKKIYTNSESQGEELEKYVDSNAKKMLYDCIDKSRISARGYYRILKLARTLADLDAADTISTRHVSEAIEYRRVNV